LFRARIWRPSLVRAGLLDDGFEARWTDDTRAAHTERRRTHGRAVHHVARHQAGGLRFHDLRHSYATPNVVQRVMGHERASTTLDLYTRRTDDSSRILRALDDEDPDDGSAGAPVPA
jgi:integrase